MPKISYILDKINKILILNILGNLRYISILLFIVESTYESQLG